MAGMSRGRPRFDIDRNNVSTCALLTLNGRKLVKYLVCQKELFVVEQENGIC